MRQSPLLQAGARCGNKRCALKRMLARCSQMLCAPRWPLRDKREFLLRVHVAQWPTVGELHLIASRNYAFEGQTFVVAAGTVLQKRDLAHLDLALFDEIPGEPDEFLMRGGSTIIAPNIECLAGPLYEEAGMVSAEIVPERAIDGHLTMDVTGHYSRPDVFQLHVNRNAQKNVVWSI